MYCNNRNSTYHILLVKTSEIIALELPGVTPLHSSHTLEIAVGRETTDTGKRIIQLALHMNSAFDYILICDSCGRYCVWP